MKKFIGKNKTFLLYANLDGSIDISNNLIYMVNFLTRVPDCDSKRPALLDWFISSDASICSTMAFLSLRNSNNVVVTVSIDFPSNPKRDAFFITKLMTIFLLTWTVVVIWEMFHGRIFLNSVHLLLLVNFVSEYRLKLMYISPIANIGSNLNHLLGF